MSVDLTEAIEAAEVAFTDSGWRQQRDDETGWIAYEAVHAAAPVIEAQVRAQIAGEIEAAIESLRRNVQSTYSLWPGMEFAVEMLRGDS